MNVNDYFSLLFSGFPFIVLSGKVTWLSVCLGVRRTLEVEVSGAEECDISGMW